MSSPTSHIIAITILVLRHPENPMNELTKEVPIICRIYNVNIVSSKKNGPFALKTTPLYYILADEIYRRY